MVTTYYSPDVHFLLLHDQEQKVDMEYIDSAERLQVPLIGPRPPYYIHPVYVPYYPII